ncbi:BglG family transcription antiterminator [Paenibacillus dendritiformis]|uniref:BglG family transcription antiterminator n=1 Tax=Paenibacillus dendritiformis TaxID=130049 RepID=UPI0002F6BA23|nr:helix-turn-helix domain-containing protein [Paenibacillus dendritiformis]CAH8770533.1 helix-turn-helix domain-containing protein [Paenibacillus dendritiformis]
MKTTERLVAVYQYLVEHDGWITTQQLAAMLSCSVSTIRNDLEILKSFLPDTWFIESRRGKGVHINRPSNQPIVPFKQLLNETDRVQHLIAYLIHNESGCTLTELSQKLFYSVSTISKIIKILKHELKKYHLKLGTKPVKIHGNEFHLRQFYFDYYLNKNSTAWIQPDALNSICTFMGSIEQKGRFKFSDTSYIQLPIVWSVWKSRLLKKQYITKFVYPTVFCESSDSFHWIIPMIEEHLKKLHIRAGSHELQYGAALILGVPRIEGKMAGSTKTLNEMAEQCHMDPVSKLIQSIEEKARLPFSDDPILFQQLYDYYKYASIRWITGIHSNANQYTIKIKESEFSIFKSVHEAMHHYFNYVESMREDDVADITMFFVASKLGYHMKQKEKTILLYVSEIGVMRYVKLKLLENICGRIKMVTTNHAHEMQYLASTKNIDIIVTTNQQSYTLLPNNIPIIHIDPIPSSYDINIIQDALKRVSDHGNCG